MKGLSSVRNNLQHIDCTYPQVGDWRVRSLNHIAKSRSWSLSSFPFSRVEEGCQCCCRNKIVIVELNDLYSVRDKEMTVHLELQDGQEFVVQSICCPEAKVL